jgi:hypothetical protein
MLENDIAACIIYGRTSKKNTELTSLKGEKLLNLHTSAILIG